MNVKITYPIISKRKVQRNRYLEIVRWPMLAAAIASVLVNWATGGKAWSLIVLMSLYMVWTLVLSPDLVEYNRISQFIKLITCTCILLTLIDVFLISGWAVIVVPIVGFGGLIVAGILFLTDLERQKQNMRPMLELIFLCLIGSIVGLQVWHGRGRWTMIVMGATALVLLIVSIIVLGEDFPRELKRRFHV